MSLRPTRTWAQMNPTLARYLSGTRSLTRQRAIFLGQQPAAQQEMADAWRSRMLGYALKREVLEVSLIPCRDCGHAMIDHGPYGGCTAECIDKIDDVESCTIRGHKEGCHGCRCTGYQLGERT